MVHTAGMSTFIHEFLVRFYLKVEPCKLYNSKYIIASIEITNTEIFALIALLVFKLLSRKVLFINKKDNKVLIY